MDKKQVIKSNMRMLGDDYYPANIESFWDMLKYIKAMGWCFQPFCTTCGCMDYRRFLKYVGVNKLSSILKKVTLDELKAQNDLDWHDALEIIILDCGNEVAARTTIQEEYDFVRNKYYELRHTYHYPIYLAREKVLTLLKDK